MKRELIIKDGKAAGIKAVYEAGDKFGKVFGEFVYLDKEPTVEDCERLTNKVLHQVFEYIKDSEKKWDCDGLKVILKSKEVFDSESFPADKIGTLGVKVTISRIVEDGEVL